MQVADPGQSVLSGLSPPAIVDIASRALRFWSYQATNEMYAYNLIFSKSLITFSCYQEMVGRNMQEKYSMMEKQAQNIVQDANNDSAHLKQKINGKPPIEVSSAHKCRFGKGIRFRETKATAAVSCAKRTPSSSPKAAGCDFIGHLPLLTFDAACLRSSQTKVHAWSISESSGKWSTRV